MRVAPENASKGSILLAISSYALIAEAFVPAVPVSQRSFLLYKVGGNGESERPSLDSLIKKPASPIILEPSAPLPPTLDPASASASGSLPDIGELFQEAKNLEEGMIDATIVTPSSPSTDLETTSTPPPTTPLNASDASDSFDDNDWASELPTTFPQDQKSPIILGPSSSSSSSSEQSSSALPSDSSTERSPVIIPQNSSNETSSARRLASQLPSRSSAEDAPSSSDLGDSNSNIESTSKKRKIVLPTTDIVHVEKKSTPENQKGVRGWIRRKWKAATEVLLRPGVQFRIRLGLIVMTGLSASTFLAPQTRLLNTFQGWIHRRGFQGISAFGRSVAYIWAVLVGYPRMLDRRAQEKIRKDYERSLDRKRSYLNSLALEVARLRKELRTIDKEIRSFRREIISLKAYAKDDNPDVREAIGVEMAQLAQLRSDTQAALAAARETWAEVRAKSQPEIWEDFQSTI